MRKELNQRFMRRGVSWRTTETVCPFKVNQLLFDGDSGKTKQVSVGTWRKWKSEEMRRILEFKRLVSIVCISGETEKRWSTGYEEGRII